MTFDHLHAYGRGACPNPDCVAATEERPAVIFAFGRNPHPSDDQQLDVDVPLGISSTFEIAKAELIKCFSCYNDIKLGDGDGDLAEFISQVEAMTFVGSTDGDCACFTDGNDDYWWIQSYEIDKFPERK